MALHSPPPFEGPDLRERPQPGSADAVLAGSRAATHLPASRGAGGLRRGARGVRCVRRARARPSRRRAECAHRIARRPAHRRHRPLPSHARCRPGAVRGPPALRQGPRAASARSALLHARQGGRRARHRGQAAQDRRLDAVVAHAHYLGRAVRAAVCARLPALRRVAPRGALAATLTLFLASIALPVSTSLFAHALFGLCSATRRTR